MLVFFYIFKKLFNFLTFKWVFLNSAYIFVFFINLNIRERFFIQLQLNDFKKCKNALYMSVFYITIERPLFIHITKKYNRFVIYYTDRRFIRT